MNGPNPPDLVIGQAELPEGANDCGCCEGTQQQTPQRLYNRPSLSVIAYRVGSHADFKRSMLAQLSSAELPALARLRTRDDDDFSIALLDGWATVCDVLTFYQERFANEGFLGTATERRSILELGRLIGYRLKPGLAASADLVFLLEQPPGAPEEAIVETPIPVGVRVQSIPGPEEKAQIFETVEELTARVAWNALQPRQSRLILPEKGDLGTYLNGIDSGLKVGDPILIVGRERDKVDPNSERWDFRRLTKIEADAKSGRTYIEWTHGLGSINPPAEPAQEDQKIFALRKRASLFGYNAPSPKLLPRRTRVQFGFPNNNNVAPDWTFDINVTGRRIFLDAIYPEFVEGSWVALTRPADVAELYKVEEATDHGRSLYALSGRSTRLTLDTNEGLTQFESNYRKTSVYGQSEELSFAETPILDPVWQDEVELAGQAEGLVEGKRLIVRGRRAQIRVATIHVDVYSAKEPVVTRRFHRGSRLTVLTRPLAVFPTYRRWELLGPGGFEGHLFAFDSSFEFVAAEKTTEFAAETALLKEVEAADDTHSLLRFDAPLEAVYDRATTFIHANVAAATHGESTQEILGAGDASRPFQSFTLKQSPLTHVSSQSESGSASTLQVRINDVLWHEVDYLYGRNPKERVYSTSLSDDGETSMHFGDGIQGARPPSGQNNIIASYRKGLGREGAVRAGTLTIALDKPLGMREVFNPLAATGGDDAERFADARRNVPITTLTLGRVVSLKDYEDFARGFAGIGNALASWAWDGESRRILVTVAGPGGAAVDADSRTFDSLVGALRSLGDPFVLVDVKSYQEATFKLKMRVKVHPDYLEEKVLAEVEARLREAYSFEARGFAQLVSLSEVISIAHQVAGVEAVDVDRLYRTVPPSASPILHDRLLAQRPTLNALGQLTPAEILTLDPAPLDGLEVLT